MHLFWGSLENYEELGVILVYITLQPTRSIISMLRISLFEHRDR